MTKIPWNSLASGSVNPDKRGVLSAPRVGYPCVRHASTSPVSASRPSPRTSRAAGTAAAEHCSPRADLSFLHAPAGAAAPRRSAAVTPPPSGASAASDRAARSAVTRGSAASRASTLHPVAQALGRGDAREQRAPPPPARPAAASPPRPRGASWGAAPASPPPGPSPSPSGRMWKSASNSALQYSCRYVGRARVAHEGRARRAPDDGAGEGGRDVDRPADGTRPRTSARWYEPKSTKLCLRPHRLPHRRVVRLGAGRAREGEGAGDAELLLQVSASGHGRRCPSPPPRRGRRRRSPA